MEATGSDSTSASKMPWWALFTQARKALCAYLPNLRGKKGEPDFEGKARLRANFYFLVTCIAIAIVLDERLVRFLPKFMGRDYFFDFTYVARWELSSLFATTFMTIAYWIDQMGNHEEIEAQFLKAANLCLILAIFLLFAAIIGISQMWLYRHFTAVFFVAIAFLFNDLFTWQGMEAKVILLTQRQAGLAAALAEAESCMRETGSNQQSLKPLQDLVRDNGATIARIQIHKDESRYSLLVVDIRMCLSFLCLALFLIVHPLEHLAYHKLFGQVNWWPFTYFRTVPSYRPRVINIWASKEYFVGGAIAFQFLVSAITYLLISARVLSTELPTPAAQAFD